MRVRETSVGEFFILLAAHALAGLPDGAGLLPMDPAEVPNQLESRRRAAATTSQLFSAVEDGAPKE